MEEMNWPLRFFISLLWVAMVCPDARASSLSSGVEFFHQKKWDEAIKHLKPEAARSDSDLAPYAAYLLAIAHFENKDPKRAAELFQRVKKSPVSRRLRTDATYKEGLALLDLKKKPAALDSFLSIERSSRGAEYHSDVLRLIVELEIDLKKGSTSKACRRTERLVTGYPLDLSEGTWKFVPDRAEVQFKTLKCNLDKDQVARRLRRLFFLGEMEKFQKELAMVLKSEKKPLDKLLLEAEMLSLQGRPDEASDLLVKKHQTYKLEPDYLKTLARSAARAERIELATHAYLELAKKALAASEARDAVFQAAILQYQHQNYDLSAELFERYFRENRTKGRYWSAEYWYLGWSNYLRGDHARARSVFDELLEYDQQTRGRHNLIAKITYWKGRLEIKSQHKNKGIELLQEVSDSAGYGYYQILAEQQLKAMGAPPRPPVTARKKSIETNEDRGPASDVMADGEGPESADELSQNPSGPEDPEVQPQLEFEIFKNPKAQLRLELARLLFSLKLKDLALWELRELESYARSPEQRMSLISFFEEMKSYNRSAYIAEVYFGTQRLQSGIEGERRLWEAAYPQAYALEVNEALQAYPMPLFLPWAIMRAESFFNPEVISPVGAVGLMQIMPNTARRLSELKVSKASADLDLKSPAQAITLGSQYLERLSRIFVGEAPLVAAGYNAGPHRVKGWLKAFGNLEIDEFIEHIPFLETRNYVKKVMRNYAVYKKLYGAQVPDGDIKLIGQLGAQWNKPTPFQEDWSADIQ